MATVIIVECRSSAPLLAKTALALLWQFCRLVLLTRFKTWKWSIFGSATPREKVLKEKMPFRWEAKMSKQSKYRSSCSKFTFLLKDEHKNPKLPFQYYSLKREDKVPVKSQYSFHYHWVSCTFCFFIKTSGLFTEFMRRKMLSIVLIIWMTHISKIKAIQLQCRFVVERQRNNTVLKKAIAIIWKCIPYETWKQCSSINFVK